MRSPSVAAMKTDADTVIEPLWSIRRATIVQSR
jgi:hypothetical protein